MSFFNGVNPQTVSAASNGFKEFKIGENYAHISKVEEKKSESGNPMLEITFVNEDGATIRYYIVDGEWKLSRLKELYTAFGIPMGERTVQNWIGKWGIVVCKAGKEYNGKTYNQVSYVKSDNDVPQSRKPNQQQQQPPRGYDDTGDEFGNANHQEEEFTDDIPF